MAVTSRPLPSAQSVRAAEVVREIAIGGLAGLVGGLLVVGVGGRLFMRVVTLIDTSSIGTLTSNGNRIGDITLGGTLGFMVFGGLLFGGCAGVLWAAVSQWLPGRGAGRALASRVVAVASFFVARADERDFLVLDPPGASVAMLVMIVAALGVVIALADDRLRRVLPATDPVSPWSSGYLAVLCLGLVLVPITLAAYFGTSDPPAAVGAALLVVGGNTTLWWAARIRHGRSRVPVAMTVVASIALLVAVSLGLVRLATEISLIVAT